MPKDIVPPHFSWFTKYVWPKVNFAGSCWEIKNRTLQGYGQIKIKGQAWYTHRLVYAALVGPLDPGLTIDHLCRNKACCNPNHLEQVTMGENVARAQRDNGGHHNTKKTSCPEGHDYDTIDAAGRRRCKRCHNKAHREAEARRART